MLGINKLPKITKNAPNLTLEAHAKNREQIRCLIGEIGVDLSSEEDAIERGKNYAGTTGGVGANINSGCFTTLWDLSNLDLIISRCCISTL